MGMDSDLGIDSIKRVEILSALQERLPGAPAIGPEHLGTLRTLADIAAHLSAGNATVSAPQTAQPASVPVQSAGISVERVTATLMAVVSEKTGYPVEMLEPDMGMDSDLGIDSIKRVEILSALQERLPARRPSARSTWEPCAPWLISPPICPPEPRPLHRSRHRRPQTRLRRSSRWKMLPPPL